MGGLGMDQAIRVKIQGRGEEGMDQVIRAEIQGKGVGRGVFGNGLH